MANTLELEKDKICMTSFINDPFITCESPEPESESDPDSSLLNPLKPCTAFTWNIFRNSLKFKFMVYGLMV